MGTQYLPSLRGAFWSNELKEARLELDAQKRAINAEDFVDNTSVYYAFDSDTQRAIKRAKIGIQLLEKKSDPKSKYDLFQRLNSGGLAANDQELRNCTIVMVNPGFFNHLKRIAESEDFQNSFRLEGNPLKNQIISIIFAKYWRFPLKNIKLELTSKNS